MFGGPFPCECMIEYRTAKCLNFSGLGRTGHISNRCPRTQPCLYPSGKCGKMVSIHFDFSQHGLYHLSIQLRFIRRDLDRVEKFLHAQEGDSKEKVAFICNSTLAFQFCIMNTSYHTISVDDIKCNHLKMQVEFIIILT